MKRFLLMAAIAAAGCDTNVTPSNGAKKVSQLEPGKIYMVRPQHAGVELPVSIIPGRADLMPYRIESGDTLRYIGDQKSGVTNLDGGSKLTSYDSRFIMVGGPQNGEPVKISSTTIGVRVSGGGKPVTQKMSHDICNGCGAKDYQSCRPDFFEVAK